MSAAAYGLQKRYPCPDKIDGETVYKLTDLLDDREVEWNADRLERTGYTDHAAHAAALKKWSAARTTADAADLLRAAVDAVGLDPTPSASALVDAIEGYLAAKGRL